MKLDRKTAYAIFAVLVALALYASSLYGYLLFHSIAELLSILVAVGIFVVAWNTRNFSPNTYLLFIGVAYLHVAFIDFIHTLAYKGMGVFTEGGSNLPTQLWIAGRYLESISLLAAPYFAGRKLRTNPVFINYFLATAIIMLAIFYGLFPDCFIEGKGLTPFKIASEYIISFILVLSVLYLRKKREFFEKLVLNLLIGSIIITIVSELAFTLYKDVYGFFNLLGHYFKIVSFYLIYAAIIKTNLRKPYESLVIEIDERKQAEGKLREKTEELDRYFNNALDLFCIADTDGYFHRVNKEWETTLGFKMEELEGKRFLDFVHPDDMKSTLETISRLEAQKEVLNFTNRYRCKDGSYRWIEWRSAPSGKLIFAAARDITERKKAEERILKLNRVYAVISQINQAIVRLREKDKLLNEACRLAVEYGKFQMAWIGFVDEETNLVCPIAYSGVEEGYLSKIERISIDDVPAGRGQTGTAIREGRHYVCDDIEKDPRMELWREEALKRGYRSSIALPIKHFGKVIGVFSLYASVPHFFDLE